MCVVNKLYLSAIENCEKYVIEAVQKNGLLEKNEFESSRFQKKCQELVFKSVIVGLKNMTPQFLSIKENNESLNKFYLQQKKRLTELKMLKIKSFLAKLFSSLLKNEEVLLERKSNICHDVINDSLLTYKHANNSFKRRKSEQKRPTVFLEKYYSIVNAATREFQLMDNCIDRNSEKEAEMKRIFNDLVPYRKSIECYSKMLEECKPYHGFEICAMRKCKISIVGDVGCDFFIYESPILCLKRKDENLFYPYDYMIICVDLELESGGSSEVEAYDELRASFDLFFRNIFDTNCNLDANVQAIMQKLTNKNIWKDTFNELIRIHQNIRGIASNDYQYSWKFNSGASDVQAV